MQNSVLFLRDAMFLGTTFHLQWVQVDSDDALPVCARVCVLCDYATCQCWSRDTSDRMLLNQTACWPTEDAKEW
jgi:hypothetical protein